MEIHDEPEARYLAMAISGVTMARWGEVNVLIGELGGRLGGAGLAPFGPPFYRYRVIGGREGPWEVEVCFSVEGEPPEPDGAIAATFEAGRYAKWLHHGHPDQLEAVQEAFAARLAEVDLEPDNTHEGGTERWRGWFEAFMTDPTVEPDPENWDTLIACRVRPR